MDVFTGAIRSGILNGLRLRGRAGRAEFWWWWLALAVLLTLTEGSAFATLVTLVLIVPSLTLLVRRLHDSDLSGWSWLVILIPAVGPFILVFWLARRGDSASNRFGPPPAPLGTDGTASSPASSPTSSPTSSTASSTATEAWPHGGEELPRSAGWDDIPPPPPTGPAR